MTASRQLIQFGQLSQLSDWLTVLVLGIVSLACTTTATPGQHISAASVLSKIKNHEPVQLENLTIDGDLDFTTLTAYPETEGTRKVVIESPVFFKNCVFTGKIVGFSQQKDQTTLCDFRKNLTFLGCKFNGEVNLQSISVAGIGCFSKSQFNRSASFEGARFNSEAYFDNLLFAQEAHFQHVHFEKMANFWKSVWAGVAYFQGTVFDGDTQFNLADFRANLDFSLCTTHGLLNFNYAQSTGRIFFDDCRFKNAVDFGNATLKEASFKGAFFDTKASFVNAKSETITFEKAFFLSQKPTFGFAAPQPISLNLAGARLMTAQSVAVE